MNDESFHAADYELVQDLLDGADAAWRRFDAECKPAILAKLRAVGASSADADEVLGIVIDKLWSQRKLESYSGRGPLLGFVRAAAANTWLEYLRKHRRMVTATTLQGDADGDVMDDLSPHEAAPQSEAPLAELLRDALLQALQQTDPEALLILRLSVLQGIRQRDLCNVWGGCHEGTISHKKQHAMEQIRDLTLNAVREREPGLQIHWKDLIEACGEGVEAILGPVDG